MNQTLNYNNIVHAFQTKFGQGYSGPVRELPASIASLRKKLHLEENTELVLAIDAGDLEEILDALVDMQYVLSGTINACGMREVFDAAFMRVHRANMQKVLATSRHSSKRDSPHDIVKPEGWTKPDLSDLVHPPDARSNEVQVLVCQHIEPKLDARGVCMLCGGRK